MKADLQHRQGQQLAVDNDLAESRGLVLHRVVLGELNVAGEALLPEPVIKPAQKLKQQPERSANAQQSNHLDQSSVGTVTESSSA